MRIVLYLFLVSVLLTSCFKEDDKIVLGAPGSVMVAQVGLGSDYNDQVFFSLDNGALLTNQYAAWDLAFESTPSGYHVWLNGGKDAFAALHGSSSYNMLTSAVNADWRWDATSWNKDSTAIGEWPQNVLRSEDEMSAIMRTDGTNELSRRVYLVDRGAQYAGNDRYRKIVFQSYDQTSYTLKYGTLDNAFTDSIVLQKDPQQAYTYFTFDNGGQAVAMEPNVNQWDFVFTRYRHVFSDPQSALPYYIVNGVLLNPHGTTAAVDSITPYDQIDHAFAEQIPLTAARNAIGYNWKYYDFTVQSYMVKPHFTYVIRDRQGYYWKLRFLDFYNDQGEKGNPKFEYQRL